MRTSYDDKRVDEKNACLRPRSYTTTEIDYLACKSSLGDPVERYALPGNDQIKWAFYIQPTKKDSLQRGTVQLISSRKWYGLSDCENYFKKWKDFAST